LVDLFEYMMMHGLTNPKLLSSLWKKCARCTDIRPLNVDI